MKIIQLILPVLLLCGHVLIAQQASFITSGTIEFEKKVNVYALIREGQLTGKNVKGNERQLYEDYQKERPQFSILKSTLHFDDTKTLFMPIDIEKSTRGFSIPMAAQINTVYMDHSAGMRIVLKSIFGESLLLKDSMRKINWKITEEIREVAGYSCRRANAIVMDSIYVVAFYTEKIHVSGGPESFSGLPGMIIELALPHEHVVWRATKVTDTATTSIKPPAKGQPVDRQQFMDILLKALKGRDAQTANLLMRIYLL
jgi:GLPGLI family protein